MSASNKTRPPIGGIAVVILAILTLAVAVVAQPGCNQVGSSPWPGAATQPMELQGHWLGLRLAAVDATAAQQFGLPPQISGVVVAEVSPVGASPAGQAGVIAGDVIVGLAGKPVSSLSTLYTLTTELGSAQALTLDIIRRGQPMTVLVSPAPSPVSPMVLPAPTMAPTPMATQLSLPSAPVAAQTTMCPHCGGQLMR